MYNNSNLKHPFSSNKLMSALMEHFILLLVIFISIEQVTATQFIPVDNNSPGHSNILSDGPAIVSADPPVDPLLTRTYVRGFKQQNPNVISIGAVLESQEAIAHFLQVFVFLSERLILPITKRKLFNRSSKRLL